MKAMPWIGWLFIALLVYFVFLLVRVAIRRKRYPFRYRIRTFILPNGSQVYTAHAKRWIGWEQLGPGGYVYGSRRHTRSKDEACNWATLHAQAKALRIAGTDTVDDLIP